MHVCKGRGTMMDDTNLVNFAYLGEHCREMSLYKESARLWRGSVVTSDGIPLSVYEAGDRSKPAVVLVNPLGISCLFMTSLVRRLVRDYYVVTWETRGLPRYHVVEGATEMTWHPQAHCRDLRAILRDKEVRPELMVTYCSGANIAIYGLACGLLEIRRLCLASPSIQMGDAGEKTDYQRVVLPLLGRIARDGMRMASLVRVLLLQASRTPDDPQDRELAVINNLPFQRDEFTCRYAELHAPCLMLDCASLLRGIRVPTLIVHGRDDDLIHGDTVRAAAAALSDGALAWTDGGGHFAIARSCEMQRRIEDFLAGLAAR